MIKKSDLVAMTRDAQDRQRIAAEQTQRAEEAAFLKREEAKVDKRLVAAAKKGQNGIIIQYPTSARAAVTKLAEKYKELTPRFGEQSENDEPVLILELSW